MTLRFKYIVGLAAVAAGLASCEKEDFENAVNGSYDGIQIIALPAGEHMMRMPEERVLKSEPTNLDQITLFDMEGETK